MVRSTQVGRKCQTLLMNADKIGDEIATNAAALHYEVVTLGACFAANDYFNDDRNFPHAHVGYLMACMSQLDLMSMCRFADSIRGGQTPRMLEFMLRYLDPQKS